MKTQRYAGLDLIRALAIFSVIGGHFFMNTGFQQAEFGGISIFVKGWALYFSEIEYIIVCFNI